MKTTLLALAVAASGAWTSANGGLDNQRSTTATLLDAKTIPHLTVRWRFHLRSNASFGAITANPSRASTPVVQFG